MAERKDMTIKLAWDNTKPIVSNKGGVKSYLGSLYGCQSKMMTVDMYPIMRTGALNIKDTPKAQVLREEARTLKAFQKAQALVEALRQAKKN